jgi:hypothetical protein
MDELAKYKHLLKEAEAKGKNIDKALNKNRDSGFGNSSFKSSLDKRSSGIGGISQDEIISKKSKSDPKPHPNKSNTSVNGAKKPVANTPVLNKSKKDMI